MAITRRQFVTRLGALAAVVGFSQAEVSKLAEAFDSNTTNFGGVGGKPRVIWIHGAECTGCSTSLLGILESTDGNPFPTDATLNGVTTGAAVGLAGVTATARLGHIPADLTNPNPFSLWTTGTAPVSAVEGTNLVNIADIVIDVIDLQYHETVMGMGGDLAAKWLNDFKANNTGTFVLVVEGALQDKTLGGAWNDVSDTAVPWCSIGVEDNGANEIDMAPTVVALAANAGCAAILPIGQCACYGGYPGCKPPISSLTANGFDPKQSQTGAKGVYDYLMSHGGSANVGKIINVPGCPTNPWWFILTVVMVMADLHGAGLVAATGGLDAGLRLKAVYPVPIHGVHCPRYKYYSAAVPVFAVKPGDKGCLKALGCKGIAANSQCGVHGWNNQQPENGDTSLTRVIGGAANVNGLPKDSYFAGHCTKAGHPCMACTEKGYPDAFVPFVTL
jgi:Ni,Fe-hydrogenase I small subunit